MASAFKEHELRILSDALDISEDAIGEYYKFSTAQWKRHLYDVKTLSSLRKDEICQHAFALLNKGSRPVSYFDSRTKKRDFYFICLQDHIVLNALRRDKKLSLLPLLVYVCTHELIHIVRFCNFFTGFEVPITRREEEEKIVHAITFEILSDLSIQRLDYVLDSYRNQRICDLAVL